MPTQSKVTRPSVYTYYCASTGGTHYCFVAKPPTRAATVRAIVTGPTRHIRIPLADIIADACADLSVRHAARRWLTVTKFTRGFYTDSPAIRRTLKSIRKLARGDE